MTVWGTIVCSDGCNSIQVLLHQHQSQTKSINQKKEHQSVPISLNVFENVLTRNANVDFGSFQFSRCVVQLIKGVSRAAPIKSHQKQNDVDDEEVDWWWESRHRANTSVWQRIEWKRTRREQDDGEDDDRDENTDGLGVGGGECPNSCPDNIHQWRFVWKFTSRSRGISISLFILNLNLEAFSFHFPFSKRVKAFQTSLFFWKRKSKIMHVTLHFVNKNSKFLI